MMQRPTYRNRPPKTGARRHGFLGWVDSVLVWSQGIGHPVMLIAGVVGFFAAMVFIVGLGNIVYKWVLKQPLVSGSSEGAWDSVGPGASRSLAEGDGGVGRDPSPEEPGSLLGVANYRSLREGRFVAAAGSHVYVFTEPLPDDVLGPDGLARARGSMGEDGGDPGNPVADGAVDGSGRYWIDDIPPGEYHVYCYNPNHGDTGLWAPQDAGDEAPESLATESAPQPAWVAVRPASPWAYKPNVQVPAGGEVSVDFRFE